MAEYNHKEAVEAAKKELAIKNNQIETDKETIASSEKQEVLSNKNEEEIKGTVILSDEEEEETKEIKDTVVLSDGDIIKFNFNYLTGKTILNLKSEFKRKTKGQVIMVDELDDFYCTFVASKISNKTYKEIVDLPYQDWLKVKNLVKDFLLGS